MNRWRVLRNQLRTPSANAPSLFCGDLVRLVRSGDGEVRIEFDPATVVVCEVGGRGLLKNGDIVT